MRSSPVQASRGLALGILAVTLALAYGIWYAYSVLLVALLKEFGWSRSVLAGAFSVFILVHGALNPLIGALCARFRPLQVIAWGGAGMAVALLLDSFIHSPVTLYVYFGLLTATAVSMAGWVPALVHVQREFKDRLGMSVGIVSSGVGLGIFLVVPLAQVLIDEFGWRWAFRVLGVVSALWIVPSSLWLMRRPTDTSAPRTEEPASPAAKPRRPRGATHAMTLRQAMGTKPFWLMIAAYMAGSLCSQTLHVHQVAYLVDHGLVAMFAATVMGVVGAASIAGKLGCGWLADRMAPEYVYIGGVSVMVLSVLVLLALGAAPTTWGALGYAVLFGAGYSVTASITPVMTSDRFSGPHYGAIVGFGLMASALTSAIGPWMAGRMYDATGSYTVAFLIAASGGVVAGAAAWWALRVRLAAA